MIASLRLAALAAAATFGLMSITAAQAEEHKPKAAAKAVAKKAVQPAPAPKAEAPLPDADEAQLVAAQRAYQGVYACEFNQSLNISPNPKHAGYVDVAWKKETFTMKPVLSSTGALRLEDVKGRTLMVQIANKSMLMDTKVGQRLVDDCQSAEQREAVAAAKLAGPQAGGLGIDPNKPLVAEAAKVEAIKVQAVGIEAAK
ncbi:hypothetical protein [Azohydromonas australica]|uniref:hypothetical protein n=1 Tax=Azohydromonas australica TaxID=364039 RepID=UPI0004177E23|nr:hypothetical protein [Azohydromonas australica]